MKEIGKPVGIWLDYRNALVIYIDDNKISKMEILSEIDEKHPVGGSGSSTPYGPQEAVSEQRHLNRRHRQQKSFFDTIISKVLNRDGIYIMGPGQAKLGLEAEIRKNDQLIQNLLDVETCHRMTEKQIKSKVMDYFHLLGCSKPARRED